MNLTTVHVAAFILLTSASAAAYEFEAESAGEDADWSSHRIMPLALPPSGALQTGMHQVKATVKPEECRLYLTYEDEGRDHMPLFQQAKLVREHLTQAFADIEDANVTIEPVNYSPEKSWRGLFRSQKAEICVTFRVTIKLATEDANTFWDNAELVAEVLERIAEAREQGDWGRKLKEGRVTYAVESIEPTKRSLLAMLEGEVQTMRKSVSVANEVDASDVFCDIEYGNTSSSSATLQEIEVVLPYRVDFALKRQPE